jgi:bifunctional non-homologous end joining protein LigD
MQKSTFEPCIPTRGTKVPAGKDWLHEIKHDGYRLIVHRDGARVRLFTRNGNDWTARYPLIVDAALKNRQTSFVIDGEPRRPVSRLDQGEKPKSSRAGTGEGFFLMLII